jgi:hypothetical protein
MEGEEAEDGGDGPIEESGSSFTPMPMVEEFVMEMATITPDRRAAGEKAASDSVEGVNKRDAKDN